MKKTIALILALVMALSLAACGGDTGTTTSNPGTSTPGASNTSSGNQPQGGDPSNQVAWEDTLVRVAIDTDPGTFDPYASSNNGRKAVLYSVYETLAVYEYRGGPAQGVLAKNWYEDGENSYVIELYDYIKDTAGNEITADDVIYCLTDAGYSIYKRYTQYIESAEKIDEYSFRLTLNSSDVGTLEHILCNVYIVDEDAYKSSPDQMGGEPIGTGPYKVDDYVIGSIVKCVANEDYWQTKDLQVRYQNQNVNTVEYYIIPEQAQRIIGIETDTIDVITRQAYATASRFMDGSYLITESINNDNYAVIFNCTDQSPCGDLAVRQAIMYAIDTEAMVQGILDGYGGAEYCVGSPLYPDVDPAWEAMDYKYDPDKAKELLADAGYANGVEIELMCGTSEQMGRTAAIFAQYLSEVGITAHINQFDSSLLKTYDHDFSQWDLYLMTAGSNDYIITCWNTYLGNATYEDGKNYNGIVDSTLQTLIETAIDKDGHTSENMTALHEHIYNNAYFCGLYYGMQFSVGNSEIFTDIYANSDSWLLPGACTYVWNT